MRLKHETAPWLLAAFVALPASLSSVGLSREQVLPRPQDTPQLRRPVALVLAENGRWLFSANQRSGSISVLDAGTGQLAAEYAVGRRLADLAITPDERHLLAVDEAANELILLGREGSQLRIAHRLALSAAPVSVQVAPDGKRCYVASLWPRQLTIVDLVPALKVARSVELPFSPRRQLLLRDGTRLVVADAFGGHLAVLDTRREEVESVRSIPGHNLRGLAVSADGERLLVAQQVSNRFARAAFEDIHWGNLLTNDIRVLALTTLLQPDADLLSHSRLIPLGDVGNGSGDPAAILVRPDGQVLVAVAGVNELAIGRETDLSWQRVAVGVRPTAVVASPDGERAYVANTLGDSVDVVDLRTRKVKGHLTLGPSPDLTASDRGEILFHNAQLSHDGWLSCHSCHTDGHTNGRLSDTMSDGTFGTPKRVLSLLGVKDTGPWAWNGSMPDLESQVRQSVESTMRGPKPSAEQVKDLVAFLQTLPPPPRLRQKDDALVRQGQTVFEKHGCSTCHSPPAYTSRKTYDVGFADEAGLRQFNPPSLRGVRYGGPFFHDNRAATLEEVFTKHRHQLPAPLPDRDLAALVAYLRSL
jgi:YVTN family beta-propeller protein